MLSAMYIEDKLSQVIHVMHEKYSLEESMDCALKLLLLKRLLDQLNEEGNRQLHLPRDHQFATGEHKLAEELVELLITLENIDPTLKEVFTDPEGNFWSRFDNETLSSVFGIFARLNLSDRNLGNLDNLSEACENFIEKYASIERYRGQVYTPKQLAKMLVELVNPGQKESIYDPVCGSGEFLAASAQFIKRSGGDLSQLGLFGQSKGIQERAITKINLVLHEVKNSDIRLGNAIFEPKFIQSDELTLFDVVLTNPPFGFKLSREDHETAKHSKYFPYGTPRSGEDGVYLFIQHVLSSLNATGKAAMILPRGVLFRGGSEKEIRKNIIEADLIEAVIELAPKLFYRTSIPVVIMVFNKNKTNKDHIFLIDASHEYETERGRNHLQAQHIEHIVSTYLNSTVEEGFSTLISIEEIAANEYDLSIDRYLTQTSNEEFDIATEVDNLRQLEAKRSELKGSIDAHLQALGIKL